MTARLLKEEPPLAAIADCKLRAAKYSASGVVDPPVLCVDLDGTLLATDVLWESIVLILRDRLWAGLLLPLWLLRGKAYLKRQVARRVELDAARLPYRPEVLDFLRQQKEMGRKIILTTASDREAVEPIAKYLEIFSDVIASDGVLNLSGKRKCLVLEERFGNGQFDYIGNAAVDLPLWRSAHTAHLVAPSGRVLNKARTSAFVQRVFYVKSNRFSTILKALRVHQWSKNLLLLAPLVTAHKIFEVDLLFKGLSAFMAFSLCASSAYVLNDLLDLKADRQHPKKRFRPFAAGQLGISTGMLLSPLLLLSGFVLALITLPHLFTAALVLYLITTIAYSFQLKRIVVTDVIVLAGLYTLRVLAGGLAVGIVVSTWLLTLSIFLFLSLAFMKRYAELSLLQTEKWERAAGRNYLSSDREWLGSMGTSSGYLSVLVLALYISSKDVEVLYRYPKALWLICPFLLYWIARMWSLAYRGQLDDDPIVVAATDPGSYVVGLVVAVIIIAAL